MTVSALVLTVLVTSSFLLVKSSTNSKPTHQASPDCVNPLKEYGYCIELVKCQSLLGILKQKPINRPSLRFLQKCTCGFAKENMPKVCCTEEEDIENWKESLAKGGGSSNKPPSPKHEPTTSTTPSPSHTPPPSPPLASLPAAFNMDQQLRRRLRRHPNYHLLPTTESCGLSLTTDRIIGGNDANLGEFPWMVLIAYGDDEGSDPQFACGGTLISAHYVLTASHCVVKLPTGYKISFIRIGEYDQSKVDDCKEDVCADPLQDIEVEQIISHPQYDVTKKKENDIALIRLKHPAVIGSFVSPICLPFELNLDTVLPSSGNITKLTVAGWGRTLYDQPDGAVVLQQVRIPLVSTQECNEYYTKTVHLGGVDNSRFCAGGEEGVDSCRGDSGGPLMEALPIGDPLHPHLPPIVRSFQFGVVSLGPSHCGSKGQPGLYTKISNYLIWILDTVRP